MDIGVLTVPLGDASREAALAELADLGVDAVELGSGGHPGTAHIDPQALLDDPDHREALEADLAEHDLRISALATHNNPLHPDEERASAADADLRRSIELADLLEVDAVTCFSGLPAGAPGDETPNWITAPWPPDHAEALAYQWEQALDYWEVIADVAADHGVKLAIEMHPNMLVYEPTGLIRLREATNEYVGANVDPSHLYWQGIDVQAAIRLLGERGAIHHVHAKDTGIYESNARTQGVLDTTPYGEVADRSWLFRTVGYGHGERHWKDVVSTLRMVGYDGALSIEHEDDLTAPREGLAKAVDVLQRAVFQTTPDESFHGDTGATE